MPFWERQICGSGKLIRRQIGKGGYDCNDDNENVFLPVLLSSIKQRVIGQYNGILLA